MFAGATVDDSDYSGDMLDYTIAGEEWWQETWYFLFHVDWIKYSVKFNFNFSIIIFNIWF